MNSNMLGLREGARTRGGDKLELISIVRIQVQIGKVFYIVCLRGNV